MTAENENVDRPVIEYPCEWGYKIIGENEEAIREAARQSLDTALTPQTGDRPFEISMSRASSGGKYVSMSLVLEVKSEKERDALFAALKGSPGVKMVL